MSFANEVYTIPISGGDEISIYHSELSTIAATSLLETLQGENCSCIPYFTFAVAYRRLNDLPSSLLFLHAAEKLTLGTSPALAAARQQILCALASASLSGGNLAKTLATTTDTAVQSALVEEVFTKIDSYYHESDKIDQFFETTWVAKGATFLQRHALTVNTDEVQAKSYLDRAEYLFELGFKEAKEEQPVKLPFYLGMAAVKFMKEDYAAAQTHYGDAIRYYGAVLPYYCGAPVRVAFGMCCYKLGQVDRARKCMARALAIDGGCVEAIVGKAVLDLAIADEESVEGRALVESAVKALVTMPTQDSSQENAKARVHLADHFFWQWSPANGQVTVDGKTATATQNVDVQKGTAVRIGLAFETEIVAKETSSYEFTLKDAPPACGTPQTLYIRDHSRVLDFAKYAYKMTMNESIKAEACFLIARVYHYHHEYGDALKYYEQARKLDPTFIPGVFGYAKMVIKNPMEDLDPLEALAPLELVIKATETAPEPHALKAMLLVHCYAGNREKEEEAISCFQRAVELDPKNAQLRTLYASVLRKETKSFPMALLEYKQAVKLTELRSRNPEPALINNTAVLLTQPGTQDWSEAEGLFKRALGGDVTDVVVSGASSLTISVAFNLARLYEDTERYGPAAAIHRMILEIHPTYIASYLRMACICNASGDMQACAEWLSQAFLVTPDNEELMALIGDMWSRNGEWEPAQQIFEKILNEGAKRMGNYASVALGNIYLCNLNTASDAAKREKFLGYASTFYRSVLVKDKFNLYAANGMGCVLAEKGELQKSKDIFTRVRESSGDTVGPVFLNLGHVYLGQSRHAEAIKSYEHYQKHFATKKEETKLLMYLAYSYFDWAKQAEESSGAEAHSLDERYRTAIKFLTQAQEQDPSNTQIVYNIAVTRNEFALAVLSKSSKNQRRTLTDVEGAGANFNESLAMFSKLSQIDTATNKVTFDVSKAKEFADHIQNNSLADWENHRAHEAGLEDEENTKRASQRAEAEEAIQREKLTKMDEAQKQQAQAERRKKIAEENEAKAAGLRNRLTDLGAAAATRKEKGGGGKRKKNDSIALGEEDSSDDEEEAGGGGASGVGGNGASTSDLFGDSDDSEDEGEFVPPPTVEEGDEEEPAAEKPTKSTIESLFESDSDDDDAGAAAEEPAVKKRKVIDDDDEE